MATAIWAMSLTMDPRKPVVSATASTQPRCVSSRSMSWRAKATAITSNCLRRRSKSNDMASSNERAVLAGGCFWGMQDLLRRYPGVISTRVGYSGGDVPNATYRNHGTHAEAIEIIFDPAKTTYRTLLEFLFQIHDPTTLNRQGNDRGSSYRSEIFYTTDEQRQTALATIADVNASG